MKTHIKCEHVIFMSTTIILLISCEEIVNCFCVKNLIYESVRHFEYEALKIVTGFQGNDKACENLKGFLQNEIEIFLQIIPSSIFNINDSMSEIVLNDQNFFLIFYYDDVHVFLNKLEEMDLLSSSTVTIISQSEEAKNQVLTQISKMEAYLDSSIYIIHMEQSCSAKVLSPYKLGPKSNEILINTWGTWSSETGFSFEFGTTVKLYKRSNFHGYPMQGVGVKVFPHFTTYSPDGGVTGYVGDIVTNLQKIHNFSLTYKVLDGYSYGKLVGGSNTPQWNGMIGELQKKAVDLTVSEVSITAERSKVISYTQPIYMISRKLYVAQREDNIKKLLVFTRPMEMSLYVMVLATVIGLSLALGLFIKVKIKFGLHVSSNEIDSLAVCFWRMYSVLVQQGFPSTPQSVSARTLVLLGFFVALVSYTSYCATLTSYLTVTLPGTLPFKDLYGLVKLNNWDAGNVKNDLFEVVAGQMCATSQLRECALLSQVWKKSVLKTEGNLVSSYHEGLARARERNYVFIGVDVTTNFYLKQLPKEEACTLQELQGKYLNGGIAIALQYNSLFLPYFEISLQNMKETGTMEKLVKKWLRVVNRCSPPQIASADIVDVSAPFIILIGGCILGIFLLLQEFIVRLVQTKALDVKLMKTVNSLS